MLRGGKAENLKRYIVGITASSGKFCLLPKSLCLSASRSDPFSVRQAVHLGADCYLWYLKHAAHAAYELFS